MSQHSYKTGPTQTRQPAAWVTSQPTSRQTFQFVDNRPEAETLRNQQAMMHNSPQATQLKAMQAMVHNSPQAQQATQLQAIANSYVDQQRHPILQKRAYEVQQTIQRQLRDLGKGFYALDEEEESLINDGTEKYTRLGLYGTVNLLEDDWGEVCLYDTQKMEKFEGDGLKKKLNSLLQIAAENKSFRDTPTPPQLMDIVQILIGRDSSTGKGEAATHLQILQPGIIPHSPKHYQSGVVTIPIASIATGALPGSGYEFHDTTGKLSVSFNGTELGFVTIIRQQRKALDVDVLEVHSPYRGMNISRILMVMLANAALATRVPTYRVGVASANTNKPFWAQYSSNAKSLLARGDHQNIDVPANPLA